MAIGNTEYLEKIARETFHESPNTIELKKLLSEQPLYNEVIGLAEKSFMDGFLVAVNSLGDINERTRK